MSEVIFRGGTILTIDAANHVLAGDVASVDGVIVHVGGAYTPQTRDYEILDASRCVVMPGLVQSHVHVCQTLARGRADDLELLDWLRNVIWPYEGALDAAAMAASARLACAELLLGGTTAIQDMGSVHHADAIFEAFEASGIRATAGKAMMDAPDPQIPPGLRESTRASLDESHRLAARWHGAANNRLQYAYAPRFVLSCTDALLRDTAAAARDKQLRIHTHASENQAEIALVRARAGMDNIAYFDQLGLTGPHVSIAHCVHVSPAERQILARTGTHVVHCPSSNLKLASGIAPLPELLAEAVAVSIGADGAPCNNNLDGFLELRLAALLHKPRSGPRALPAPLALRLATQHGADALGLGATLGSLTLGKRADIIAVELDTVHTTPAVNPYSAIVYSARATDVRHVAVDGAITVRDHRLLTLDVSQLLADARTHADRTFAKL